MFWAQSLEPSCTFSVRNADLVWSNITKCVKYYFRSTLPLFTVFWNRPCKVSQQILLVISIVLWTTNGSRQCAKYHTPISVPDCDKQTLGHQTFLKVGEYPLMV